MNKDVLKYAAIIAPFVALITCVGGWVAHVESGLRAANDVSLLREQIAGINRDLGYQRGRISNLESLFEPYLIQKRAEEMIRQQSNVSAKPVPKAVEKEAKVWAHSQINRGVDYGEMPSNFAEEIKKP